MRDRNISSENATLQNGYIVVQDKYGLSRWSNNPRDRDNSETVQGYDINRVRLSAIERLIEHRHGGPCNTDDGYSYLSAAFNAIALSRAFKGWSQSLDPMVEWALKWTPNEDCNHILQLAERVTNKPRMMRAERVGKLIALSFNEWKLLALKTIYPCDVELHVVETYKKDIHNSKRRAKYKENRKANNRQSRADYERNSIAAEARRLGVSRQTIYNRRAKITDTGRID